MLRAAEAYSEAHQEQYEWVGGYITNFTFTWGPEVEALKSCDYVLPAAPMHTFAREYREAGYTAKFVGTDAHISMLGLIDDADLWQQVDGTLIIRPCRGGTNRDRPPT